MLCSIPQANLKIHLYTAQVYGHAVYFKIWRELMTATQMMLCGFQGWVAEAARVSS